MSLPTSPRRFECFLKMNSASCRAKKYKKTQKRNFQTFEDEEEEAQIETKTVPRQMLMSKVPKFCTELRDFSYLALARLPTLRSTRYLTTAAGGAVVVLGPGMLPSRCE